MDFTHYNLFINPTGLAGDAAATYTRQVTEHLTWILRTTAGKILLSSIRFHGRPVVIEPYTNGDCNAFGGGKMVGGGRQGIVRYSPGTFSLHGACSATTSRANRGMLWDEMLHHELVHVLRFVSGKWSKAPLGGGLYKYDDTEEFLAVLVTNIYISDGTNRIRTGLRADHHGFNPLQPDLAGSWGFFSAGRQVFPLVKQLFADNYGFAIRVANDVKAPFNPLADYIANPERAESASKGAIVRDVAGLVGDLLNL